MKFMRIPCVMLLAIVLNSCNRKNDKYVATFKNDMDMAYAWTDSPPSHIIQNPKAHSGRYVCRLDAVNSYSPTYNEKVANISDKKFTKVKISAWMKADVNDAQPSLVIDIKDSTGKTIEWLGKNFTGKALSTKDWEYYENVVDLSKGKRLDPTNIYRIYIMNDKPSFTLVDDFEINYY